MEGRIRVEFYGGLAREQQLDLYDAGRSVSGLGRTVSILGHYYQTGNIIYQAPSSSADVRLTPFRPGSFLIDIIVGVTASLIAVPPSYFITRALAEWMPGTADAERARANRLQAELLRQGERTEALEDALHRREEAYSALLEQQRQTMLQFEADRRAELDVLRSILSPAYSEIFRPVGRSAEYALTYGDAPGSYVGVFDKPTVDAIENEVRDETVSEVTAVVNAFSRSSKTGTAFSAELGRGFRFRVDKLGPLSREDDFSWSQYYQKPLLMYGFFYRFPDGTLKRLEVTGAARLEDER